MYIIIFISTGSPADFLFLQVVPETRCLIYKGDLYITIIKNNNNNSSRNSSIQYHLFL